LNVQIIEKNSKPEWAVVPYEEYQRLVEEAEMLQDIRDYFEIMMRSSCPLPAGQRS